MDNWKRLGFLPLKELKELQNRKLRHFISTQLYPFSPYYRNLFDRHKIKPRHIKTIDDLKIIPFTSKNDLLPNKDNPQVFRDFILQPDETLVKKYGSKNKLLWLGLVKAIKGKSFLLEQLQKEYRPIFLTATTGTSNQPVSFLYSDFDIRNLHISGYRLLEVFGAGGDVRAVNLFPYAPHLAFWQTVFAAIAHNNFLLSTGGGKLMGTQGNVDAISKVSPEILIGEPNYLYHLLRSARELGRDFGFIRKIIIGASRIPLGFKEKLASLLGNLGARDIHILGTYGFTEAKCVWGECPTAEDVSSGYHTYPDKEVFEVIDPVTAEVKKEGEDGELVYTSIDARGSCVLRYRTQDLVKGGIIYERCTHCLRRVPRIASDITRATNIKDLRLSKIKGTLVNLNDVSLILDSQKGIEEWQVELRKKDNDPYEVDELVIYLSLTSDSDPATLGEDLKSQIKTATEVTPNAIIILAHKEMLERVEMESAHKAKRFIDTRPKV